MTIGCAYLGGDCLIPRVELATGTWERMRGLLGRGGMARGAAMLLSPCGAVHTFGMRFAIDVAFLDRNYRITALRREVRPNRLAWGGVRARHALEAQAGRLPAERLPPGTRIDLRPLAEPAPPGNGR